MIDELEVVRRLGADEAPAADPAVRARVRARVLQDRQGGERRRRWLLPIRVLLPAAGVAAGVALVLATSGGDRPEFRGEREPGTAPPALFPEPDQFLYTRSAGRHLDCAAAAGADGRCRVGPETEREVWVSERHRGRIDESRLPDGSSTIGPIRLRLGNRTFSHDELASYEPTLVDLVRDLKRGRVPGQGGDGPSYAFVQLTDALREVPMPPRVRRAIIGALPRIPRVTDLGPATDTTGRRGSAYAMVEDGQRTVVIVDPESLTMLEDTTTLVDPEAIPQSGLERGALIGRSTYLERAVVARAGERP